MPRCGRCSRAHDGVVDQEADAQRHRHERQEIDREPEREQAMNVAITLSGSVRPVMTVLRRCAEQEHDQHRQPAPSRMVLLTRLTLFSTCSAAL